MKGESKRVFYLVVGIIKGGIVKRKIWKGEVCRVARGDNDVRRFKRME
jgi:hypothetical protein